MAIQRDKCCQMIMILYDLNKWTCRTWKEAEVASPMKKVDRVKHSFVSVHLCGTKLSRAVNLLLSRSEINQRAIKALKSESYSRSLKYCVLFIKQALHNSCELLRINDSEWFKNLPSTPPWTFHNESDVPFLFVYHLMMLVKKASMNKFFIIMVRSLTS